MVAPHSLPASLSPLLPCTLILILNPISFSSVLLFPPTLCSFFICFWFRSMAGHIFYSIFISSYLVFFSVFLPTYGGFAFIKMLFVQIFYHELIFFLILSIFNFRFSLRKSHFRWYPRKQ